MTAQAAKIRSDNVEIQKDPIKNYEATDFQTSLKTYQVKLPNSCTIIKIYNKILN